MKNLIFILAFLGCQLMAFGQGWQRILKDSMYINSACNDYDGGYLLAGRFTRINAFGIIKTDAKGRKMWAKQFPDVRLSGYADRKMGIRQSPDSLFILYGSTDSFATNYGFSLRKLDRNGNILWEKVLPLEYGVLRVTRNDYVVMGKSITTSSQMILRLNLNGDIIFQKINQATQVADFEVQRDGLFCVDFTNASTFRLNFEGQLIRANGQLAFNPIQPGISKVVQLSDSSLCVTHNGLFVSKNTKNGDSIWTRALATYFTPPPFSLPYYWDFVPSENGGFVGVDRTSRANGAAYLKYDKDGNIVWNRLYPYDKTVFMATLIKCSEGGYLMVGMYDYNAANKPLLIKINEDGFVYPNYVEGKVVRDMDKNCQITATDPPFKNCIVEVKNSQSDVFWGITDPTGRYSINVDTGNYTLKAYPLQNRDYWQSCTPSVSKTFSSLKRVDTVDFALKPIIDCPAMDVHITTPILRRCFTNTYVVNYANKGTIVANNAYLNVTLDSLLEFVSASKTVTYRTGCTLRFNLGNVGVGDDGRFDLTTRVRCGDSTRLGQTLCVEAKIYPDTICTPLPLWSGANIEVTGVCQTDSVLFQIRNTGTAASSVLRSIVIEDQVLRENLNFQLPQNGVLSKKVPANGRTWRIVAEQEPNNPMSWNPTAFVEGCRANASFPISSGFVTRFPNDDRAATIDVDCRQIVGAYDPNDKAGYPTGYGVANFIAQNQDIDYTVRFQNTGTDTAFTIVVRDTISDKLDVSSIEFGSSSHAYETEIYGKGIVKFIFNNIKLVDSFKNEAKSHGFVQYRIKQKKDLVWGTKIYNSAGIYFDFNDPIITNRTEHTVGGKAVISAIIDKNTAANFPIKVSPNPFTETAIFELPLSIEQNNKPFSGDFELLDMTGKVLKRDKINGLQYIFERKDLPSGIYVFKISNQSGPLSIGKLIVQ